MTHEDHDVQVLNDLIEVTIDSAEGYAEAAGEAKDERYGAVFRSRADERRQVVGQLQERVRVMGGQPEDEGSVLAGAHRWFVNLRQSLSRGDQAVIDEVERGEDHIRDKYEQAMKDARLSPGTQAVIASAFASVSAGHDQASRIKHAAHERL